METGDYYHEIAKARKNCYCKNCKQNIEKGNDKYLIYVVNEIEHHQTENKNGETLVDIFIDSTLIGITHFQCMDEFIEKNKKETEDYFNKFKI